MKNIAVNSAVNSNLKRFKKFCTNLENVRIFVNLNFQKVIDILWLFY